MTEGAFNIASPAVDAWNIPAEPRLPTAEELAALKPLIDLQHVHTDVWERTIYLERPGCALTWEVSVKAMLPIKPF
jgi:thiamine biosynthesis lipoprotein ApbE